MTLGGASPPARVCFLPARTRRGLDRAGRRIDGRSSFFAGRRRRTILRLRVGVQFENRNVQRFRGGLVFKAHRLCVSLNSRLGSNKEEEEGSGRGPERRREMWRAAASERTHKCAAEMCSGSEAGSYLRLIDVCITLLYHHLRLIHFCITRGRGPERRREMWRAAASERPIT